MFFRKTLTAMSLIGAITLSFLPINTYAERDYNVRTSSDLPEEISLVASKPTLDDEHIFNLVYNSETAYQEYEDSFNSCNSEDVDCMKNAFRQFYDKNRLIFFEDVVDIHLEDAPDHEIEYNDDDIEISFDSHINYDENVVPILSEYSSLEWKPIVLHITSDNKVEYLPATVDGNTWTFTTNSFSLFSPAAIPIEEEAEPVKTLDATISYIGIIVASLVTTIALGYHLTKTRR